ncbi:efflux RND transporter periplasmic adaptor subunit [Dactylosporangium sp. NPDC049140]|jgi:macrolide-specific efflux system membrane fusion protein|uniref:efflux RND transporter periplasmic adaptor subunit n=1 Tax=Dactylosporangium sp. NPDC049140 TaxID=3155647 RepID=UPI0033E97138
MRLSLPSLGKPRINSVTLVNTVLVLAAVGGAFWAYQIVNGPAANAGTGTSTTRTRLVAVSQGTVSQTVSATGSVASASTANANFATSGTVTEVDVKVGDVVTKGQTLAKVDPTAAQASLDTAKANLTAAKAALTRDENNSADDATIASAEAQVATAQANVTSAQTTVNGTVLTAPIAGTVTAVSGAVGSSSGGSSSSSGGGGSSTTGSTSSTSSSSGSGFVQIADLSKLQINASFAEADATKLKAAQTANITWSALSGTRATGKVATISPTATTANNVNSYAVTISLDSLPEGVRLGQSTTAVVTVAEAQNVLRIPSTALRTAGGQRTVQVQVNGQNEDRQVEVGITGGGFVEVKSGLQAGEQVVITTTTTNSTTGTNNQQQFPGGGNFGGGGGNFPGAGAGGIRGGN